MTGRVVHFEIPADNLERAQSFYKKAFGWQINTVPGMNYAMVGTTPSDKNGIPTQPGAINGGMLTKNQHIKSPVIYIHVNDIEEALKNVQKLGGTVVQKRTAVGHDRLIAYFKDPEGNIIGIFQDSHR